VLFHVPVRATGQFKSYCSAYKSYGLAAVTETEVVFLTLKKILLFFYKTLFYAFFMHIWG